MHIPLVVSLITLLPSFTLCFFFNAPPTTQIYTLSLHDALPISIPPSASTRRWNRPGSTRRCSLLTTTRATPSPGARSEEHTSELQSRENLVCRLLLEKKKKKK